MVMSRILRVLLSAFLAATAASQAQAACKLHVGSGDLPLEPDHERALAKGAVNGHPVTFIVDTGAWVSTMPLPDARRLGVTLEGSRLWSEGIGGSVPTTQGHMNLELGDLKFPGEAMTVISRGSLDHKAVALLGLDLLAQYDLEFNLPANLMRLVKVDGCTAADLAYWNPDKPVDEVHLEDDGTPRPAILFNVSINGHVIPAQLDSGSPQTVVTLAAARAAGADLNTAKSIEDIGGIGAHRISAQVARFDTFSIGHETIRNAKIIVSDMWKYNKGTETGSRLGAEAPEVFRPRMLLGADFLRSHRVLVVNSMRLLAFSYVGGPVFDTGDRPAPAQPTPSQPPSASSP